MGFPAQWTLLNITTENSDLKTKLSLARGEKTPLTFSNGEPPPHGDGKGATKQQGVNGLSENLNKFAQSLPVAGNK